MNKAIMELIVNEGKDRETYRGTSGTYVLENEMPAFLGGVTMTIRVSRMATQVASKSNITVDSEISGGVPSIGQGNEPISHILEKLALGISPDMLIKANPELSLLDVQFALKAAAWVMKDPSIDWQSLNLNEMIEYQDELNIWQGLSNQVLESDYPTED
jgi:uncharacterized protein (DUF433 family)